MPLVKTGGAHGHTFPAEQHAAFHSCLAAHVESPGSGHLAAEGLNHPGVHPGADEHLRAAHFLPEGNEPGNGGHAGGGVCRCAAGKHRVKAQLPCLAVGFFRVPAHIDATVKGQGQSPGGLHQLLHGSQLPFRGKAADDKAAGSVFPEHLHLPGHHGNLLPGVEKVPGSGAHEAPDGDIRKAADVRKQFCIGGQSPHRQGGAQLQPGCPAGYRCPGRIIGIHANFQYLFHKNPPDYRVFITFARISMSASPRPE